MADEIPVLPLETAYEVPCYEGTGHNQRTYKQSEPEKSFSSLMLLPLPRKRISYMTETTESRLRDNLTERQKQHSNEAAIITIPDENKQQIENICKKVRQFLDDSEQTELEIDRCNAFVRRLLFQELGSRFKKEAYVETKILDNKDRVLKVSKLTSDNDVKNRDAQKKEKEWEDFEDAVGFSKVARMISQSEKLVVGHNMLLDVLHTLNHFFHPLPADYASFKEFAHCMFPRLLDTKYMSSLPPFKDKVNSSVLHHLLSTLSEPPFSLPKAGSLEGRGYCQSDEKLHEAGYDAYVTGLCFLAMHAHLSRMRGDVIGRVCNSAVALKPFVNKIYLSKTAHQDSPYMNFSGADPSPSREHVFHLTFPKEWQRNDLNQLFSPFGPITVQFLDDTSALVALSRREQARDVQRALAHNSRISLVPYARYKLPAKVSRIHKESETFKHISHSLLNANSPDATRMRLVNSSSASRTQLGQRVERPRSNSMSSSLPQPTTRKRTSSGVFQVDEAEPPPKKSELLKSTSGDEKKKEILRKKSDISQNGRRKEDPEKDKETSKSTDRKIVDKKEKGLEKKDKDKGLDKDKKIIDKFDSSAKSACVSAFKESDSWD
ncbi:poly(A)-specific ribonuclease PARN-like [Hyposmocoma kahamanoa]|uniref:poly(A)-specific ribonuclease PARN-like n=1 Tax=Hyposmocoma kahamanoa TaxID=1477025 RepID=UPI000E6D9267|nr:poly(A)-specific ribonuclease PARN-like [Hyposmocoma kahamanoa]